MLSRQPSSCPPCANRQLVVQRRECPGGLPPYTDHLGNITGWSDAAGVYLSNSIALHEPFGAYRFRPPASVNPGIRDRGFTGHRMNNTGSYGFGLIYMNARYYLPEIGRFISPDTIVPEPSNPQSFNRYVYVRNSPMNFTDPTGHREIGADENELLPNQPPPSIEQQLSEGYNVYGITFTADSGEEWTHEQMAIVLRAAAAVDRQLRLAGRFSGYMPGHAFRRGYGSYTMLRSSKERDYGGHTFSEHNRIEFYDPAFDVRAISLKLNVVHELGHAFNGEVVTRSAGTPYQDLGAALDVGGQLAGLAVRGGMEEYPWQQTDELTDGELFADYFLNWVYDSFLSNDAGISQSIWMIQQMPGWLD